jgi:hypothetical protein
MARQQWWDEARALYAAGISRRELAQRFGRGENMVGKVLRCRVVSDIGEEPHRLNDSTCRCKPARVTTKATAAEILRLHARGMPRTSIAAQLRIRYAEISAALGDPPFQFVRGVAVGRRGIPSDRLVVFGVR